MIIHYPCIITPRLLPGIQVADAFISIEYSKKQDGRYRVKYTYHLDFLPDENGKQRQSYTGNDLSMGHQSIQGGLETLLFFLASSSEALPKRVQKWAQDHTEELGEAQYILETEPNLIEE